MNMHEIPSQGQRHFILCSIHKLFTTQHIALYWWEQFLINTLVLSPTLEVSRLRKDFVQVSKSTHYTSLAYEKNSFC